MKNTQSAIKALHSVNRGGNSFAPSYVGSTESLDIARKVLEEVRNANTISRSLGKGTQFKAHAVGVLGKDNPHAKLYKGKSQPKLEHAGRIDLFIEAVV